MRYQQDIVSPCCKCEDRVPPTKETNGCKAYCEKLKEYEQLKAEEYAERKRIRDEDMVIMDYKHESRDRHQNFMRKHRMYKTGKKRR